MEMSSIDLWKLATELSVVHAALLIAGQDPSDFEHLRPENFGKRAPQFLPAKIALCNAILSGTLKPARESFYTDGDGQISGLDIYETTIKTTDIAIFVRSRGFVSEIFDTSDFNSIENLSRGGRYYSAKLDAANKAWAAVTADPDRLRGRTPKQALIKWLTENAAELQLLRADGKPNTTGIEEISKVANWKPEGGAAATPSATATPISSALIPTPSINSKGRGTAERESFSADWDDEIPF